MKYLSRFRKVLLHLLFDKKQITLNYKIAFRQSTRNLINCHLYSINYCKVRLKLKLKSLITFIFISDIFCRFY